MNRTKDTLPDEFHAVCCVLGHARGEVRTLEAGLQDGREQGPPLLSAVVPRHLGQQPAIEELVSY